MTRFAQFPPVVGLVTQKIKFKLIDTGSDLLELFKSSQSDRAYHFWERRPFVATMNDRKVLLQKLDYIHMNPVKADLCAVPEEYVFSSASFYFDKPCRWTFLTHYTEHI